VAAAARPRHGLYGCTTRPRGPAVAESDPQLAVRHRL